MSNILQLKWLFNKSQNKNNMVSKGLIAVKQSIEIPLEKLKLNTKKSHSR